MNFVALLWPSNCDAMTQICRWRPSFESSYLDLFYVIIVQICRCLVEIVKQSEVYCAESVCLQINFTG